MPSVNSTNSPSRKNFGSDKKPPKPPKVVTPVRLDKQPKGPGGSGANKPAKGPKASRFDPDERKGQSQKFKGGARDGTESICKRRYQQISISALGEVNSTSARIL